MQSALTLRTYSYRQIWQVAFPIMLSVLMEQIVIMTDTAFLGRVGEVELGASALGGIFYVVVFMLGLGFSVGVQIVIGRRNGEGRYAEVGDVFWHGLVFLLLLAGACFFLFQWLAPVLLPAMISSREVCAAAADYLDWRVYGFFFAFVNSLFRALYVGTTRTRVLTLNSLLMVAANVVLDYGLVFGRLGLPAMGIGGAALASTLASGVSTFFFVVYTRAGFDFRRFGLSRCPAFRPELLGQVLGISVWSMIQNLVSLSTWFFFFLAIESLGSRALAASNMVRSVSAFTFMAVMALASTGSTLTSNLIGAGEPDAVRPLLARICRMGYAILVPVCLLIALMPDVVLGIFTDRPELLDAARPTLYVLLASYVFTVAAQVYFQAVSGTGATRVAFAFEMCALLLYVVYIAVVVYGFRAPLAVCWTGEFVYGAVSLLLSYLYIRRGAWRTRRL
ncbi:MAG: MATE family efflux transporter [Prevotellaceae bacterium]|nr:MATE family efflux transporter [Prevotellaceae bacterium]